MKRAILYLLIFVLAVLLESSLLAGWSSAGIPALLVPLLVSLAFWEEDRVFVLVAASTAGLLQDLVCSYPLGFHFLVYLLCTQLLYSVRRLFFAKGFIVWLLSVLLFDLTSQLMVTVLFLVFGGSLTGSVFGLRLLWHLLYTILAAVPLYPLCRLLRIRRPSERFTVLG
jgi:rod shape-determining protein MreD